MQSTPWDKWRRRFDKLRQHPRPMRLLASRALWHAGLSSLLHIRLDDGLRLRFYPSSISAALWVDGDARSDDVAFLRSILREGDTYIDVGANIGHLAIVARKCVGPSGSVTALEANPRIHHYCTENLRLNGFDDVLSINAALGETRGIVQITDRRDDDQNRIGESGIAVPMRTLDELVSVSAITLLKLDVEGFELSVLRGARSTLTHTKILYCELSASNAARFGYEPHDAEQYLLDAGFLIAYRRDDGWHVGAQTIYSQLDPAERPRTGYNVVAVKRDAVPLFSSRLAQRGESVIVNPGGP